MMVLMTMTMAMAMAVMVMDDGDVSSHGKHYCHCFPMLPNCFILRVLLFMRTIRVIAVALFLRHLLQTRG